MHWLKAASAGQFLALLYSKKIIGDRFSFENIPNYADTVASLNKLFA